MVIGIGNGIGNGIGIGMNKMFGNWVGEFGL